MQGESEAGERGQNGKGTSWGGEREQTVKGRKVGMAIARLGEIEGVLERRGGSRGWHRDERRRQRMKMREERETGISSKQKGSGKE